MLLFPKNSDQYFQSLIDEAEYSFSQLGRDKVAALFMDTFSIRGSFTVPPKKYFQALKSLCDHYEALLVIDEVITGFWRTGLPFAHQHFDIEPDIVISAKAISSGYFPVSAVIIKDKISQALQQIDNEPFFHGFTASGHPAGVCAAIENISILSDPKFIQNTNTSFELLEKQLLEYVGIDEYDLSVIGNIFSIRIEALVKKPQDDPCGAFTTAAFENELIVLASPNKDSIVISPPLCITREEVHCLTKKILNVKNRFS